MDKSLGWAKVSIVYRCAMGTTHNIHRNAKSRYWKLAQNQKYKHEILFCILLLKKGNILINAKTEYSDIMSHIFAAKYKSHYLPQLRTSKLKVLWSSKPLHKHKLVQDKQKKKVGCHQSDDCWSYHCQHERYLKERRWWYCLIQYLA